jgi:tetratricopeptide (TPR) repeat protein
MEERFELIDRYFENALSPEERLEFNDLLQNNESFRQEFMFHKNLKSAIVSHQNEELKETLKSFESKLSRNSRFSVIPTKWLAAASLAILLTLGSWMVKNYVFPSNERIFESYYEPYPNTVVPIVRGNELHTIEYRAFLAYEAEEYHKAINLFNSVENSEQKYIQFYRALCMLSVEKTEEAIETLIPLTESSPGTLQNMDCRQKAIWYVGLAYLRQGRQQEALHYMDILRNQNEELRFKKEEADEVYALLK